MMKKGLLLLGLIVVLAGGALAVSGKATKDHGDELSMALDNVNPLVKRETVYGRTNRAISHSKGQMGEDVYTYQMQTVNGAGASRRLTFTADHRLKLDHYLKIDTKGQNVNSWEAVAKSAVPASVKTSLD